MIDESRIPGASEEVLDFWFGSAADDPAAAAARNAVWYAADARFDAQIVQRFGDALDDARNGRLDGWAHSPRGALALVIVLDQFPRNVWRGEARCFSCDAAALAHARAAIDAGHLDALTPPERVFLAMPFQHAESLDVQRESVALYERLVELCDDTWRDFASNSLDFARRHHNIVARFGRFPHRNGILGRPDTEEERRWLDDGGEAFGTGSGRQESGAP